MEFDDARRKAIADLLKQESDDVDRTWTPESIFERLDRIIIGNTGYKQALAMGLADYMSPARIRNHMLVVGPSGSGKTYLIDKAMPILGLPYLVIDAAALSPSGYKGNTLQDSLAEFFKNNANASQKAVIILDEFDKISSKANGGDEHKCASIQGELLTLIQGKQEGVIDTRKSLWIMMGAFAFADEMKRNPPIIKLDDLVKYSFKNELLGRMSQLTMTDIPTYEELIDRILSDESFKSLFLDLEKLGFTPSIENAAIATIAQIVKSAPAGMRMVLRVVTALKREFVFKKEKGQLVITSDMVKKAAA